jgi:predicted kinase
MPATGKSTLAETLADALSWPLFTKDTFKELLYDAGHYDAETFTSAASEMVGAQAIALLHLAAQTLVRAGPPVILEANFRADLAAGDFAALVRDADVRQVYCTLDLNQVLAWYQERLRRGERHPVHLDSVQRTDPERELRTKDYGPIALDIPTLMVDTDNGFDPPIPEVIAFCRQPPAS